jgi:hypothetical protein
MNQESRISNFSATTIDPMSSKSAQRVHHCRFHAKQHPTPKLSKIVAKKNPSKDQKNKAYDGTCDVYLTIESTLGDGSGEAIISPVATAVWVTILASSIPEGVLSGITDNNVWELREEVEDIPANVIKVANQVALVVVEVD